MGFGTTNPEEFSRPGASRHLGLDVKWRYSFIGPGELARSQVDAVYLDVGGCIEPGVIDHHQRDDGGMAGSTARLVLENPHLVHEHLLKRWIHRADERDLPTQVWSPLVVVHRAPDVDAFVSAALVRRLIENGGVPREAAELAEFTDKIDQGDFELSRDSGATLLGMLAILQHADDRLLDAVDGGGGSELDQRRMRIGVAIVEAWLERAASVRGRARERRGLVISDEQKIGALAGLRVDPIAAEYERQLQAFEQLVEHSPESHRRIVARIPTSCPATSREAVEVSGVVLSEAFFRASSLSRYFARAGIRKSELGLPHLVIEDRGVNPFASSKKARHYVVSIRRGMTDEHGRFRRPNLRGLGLKLERLEQRRRDAVEDEDVGDRHGRTRFEEFPGIADPWYDGRAHGHSIVETPRDGSILDFDEVVAVVGTAFWEPDLSDVSIGVLGSLGPWRKVPIDDREVDERGLREAVRRAETDGYRVLQLKVHPAWDLQSIDEEVVRFVGGRMGTFSMEGVEYVFGRKGLVCMAAQHVNLPDFEGLMRQVEFVWRMQMALDRLHEGLKAPASTTPDGHSSSEARASTTELIDGFVLAISEFRRPTSEVDGQLAVIRLHVMQGLDLENQIEATDRLLEHLDDRAERESSARINLVLLLLGVFGLFEVFSSLLEHFEPDLDWAGGSEWIWLVIFGLSLTCMGAVVVAARHRGFAQWLMVLVGVREPSSKTVRGGGTGSSRGR